MGVILPKQSFLPLFFVTLSVKTKNPLAVGIEDMLYTLSDSSSPLVTKVVPSERKICVSVHLVLGRVRVHFPTILAPFKRGGLLSIVLISGVGMDETKATAKSLARRSSATIVTIILIIYFFS